MTSLETELQKIHDSEINAEISWFFDGVWTIKLGDAANGFIATEHARKASEILPRLQRMVKERYPNSTYARSLTD